MTEKINIIIKGREKGLYKEEEIIATVFIDRAFCYHKAMFGLKGYTITHIPSGLALATGKLKHVKKAIDYLITNLSVELKEQCKDEYFLNKLDREHKDIFLESRRVVWGENEKAI